MVLRSYAKINLNLVVIKRRDDGYHQLSTIFQRISLYDTVKLTPRCDSAVKISSNDPLLPQGENNLAYKSAALIKKALRINAGINIRIIKRIPVGSGLGGGSSNAASVLLGLNRLWKLNLTVPELARLALRIGSDTPFFVYDTPFALGGGRGEIIRPLPVLSHLKPLYIIVVPKTGVLTKTVYAGWDRRKSFKLTSFELCAIVNNRGLAKLTKKEQSDDIRILPPGKTVSSSANIYLANSLEQITWVLYPQVREIKQKFQQLGISSCLMSGSGGAFYAVFDSRAAAEACRRLFKNKSWRIFLASSA